MKDVYSPHPGKPDVHEKAALFARLAAMNTVGEFETMEYEI